MEVQMLHRLCAIAATVGNHAETALCDALLFGDDLDSLHHGGSDAGLIPCQFQNIRHVLFRYDQHMHRRLRVDIAEGVYMLILIDLRGRDIAGDDLAKQTTHRIHLLHSISSGTYTSSSFPKASVPSHRSIRTFAIVFGCASARTRTYSPV